VGLLWKRPGAGFLASRGARYGAGKEKAGAFEPALASIRLVTLHHEARQWLIHHPTWSKLYLQGCESNHGLSVPEIGRQAGISRIQAYRLVRGDVRRPSFETVTRLQRLEKKLVIKAGRPHSAVSGSSLASSGGSWAPMTAARP